MGSSDHHNDKQQFQGMILFINRKEIVSPLKTAFADVDDALLWVEALTGNEFASKPKNQLQFEFANSFRDIKNALHFFSFLTLSKVFFAAKIFNNKKVVNNHGLSVSALLPNYQYRAHRHGNWTKWNF